MDGEYNCSLRGRVQELDWVLGKMLIYSYIFPKEVGIEHKYNMGHLKLFYYITINLDYNVFLLD